MRKIILTLALIPIVFASAETRAEIVWESEYNQFRYAVDSNGGTFKSPFYFGFLNPTDVKTNLGGGAGLYSGSVSTTADPMGLIELKAGAEGPGSSTSPEDGLIVKAFAEINLDGFVNTAHGVNVEQDVKSFVTRNFAVTSDGSYLFGAKLNGIIDFNTFGDPEIYPPYGSSSVFTATASIDEYKDMGLGPPIFVRSVATFLLNDGNPQDALEVDFRRNFEGNPVFYQLRVVLEIEVRLANALFESITNPAGKPDFVGPFNIGSAGAPLVLEASVTDALVFTSFPQDVTISCAASTDPADTGIATAEGGCSGVTVEYTDVFDPTCGDAGIISRTWTATDSCNNSISEIQIITVQDVTDPVFESFPQDVSVGCGDSIDPNATGSATATDDCGEAIVSYSDTFNPTCGAAGVVTRTWTATDLCGNETVATQTITVTDTTPPAWSFTPIDTTVECGTGTDPSVTGEAVATDACNDVVVSHQDSFSQTCGNTRIINRTWTATDSCGNWVDAVQFITIQDTTDPAFDYVPGDVTVDLNAGESTDPSETGTAEASDACGDINVTYSDQVTPGGENTQIITRTWTATDGCGNSSSALQILTVLGEQHAISLSPLFELLLGR